ncbi:putative necrosis-inducing factor-domain-containing protein [Podospora australis]|uniref:Necrosis-inducing factor-domain-containing protein n=1 Tax=Podospora australis TaxID=1536484 RepID=A0AAN6WHK8_9PEZI|nr:putative necrosis-inducing factor-domain-containing protein [Podospora australis]
MMVTSLFKLVATGLLATVVSGSPALRSRGNDSGVEVPDDGFIYHPNNGTISNTVYTYCKEDQTTEVQTSDASPFIQDCQVLMNNIAGDGVWEVWQVSHQKQIAHYRSCAFGVEVEYVPMRITQMVGNGDIMRAITNLIDANAKAGRNSGGRVGGKGHWDCSAQGVFWSVYWNNKKW